MCVAGIEIIKYHTVSIVVHFMVNFGNTSLSGNRAVCFCLLSMWGDKVALLLWKLCL